MTTKNILQAAQAAGTLATLGQNFGSRDAELTAEDKRLEQREKDILLGAAVAVQVVHDERAVLREERDQLDEIKARATQLGGTASTPSASEQEASQPLAQQPSPGPVVAETTPAPAEPAPASVAEVTSEPETPTLIDFRSWKLISWGFFALGVLIGLFIAAFVHLDAWTRDQNEFFGWIFTVLWWLGLPTLIGGLLGSLGAWFERRR